jgi:hypothetical protein
MKLYITIFALNFCLVSTQVHCQNSTQTLNHHPEFDAIYSSFNSVADSLNHTFAVQTRLIDSLALSLNHMLDSIQDHAARSKVFQLIDSIDRVRGKTIAGLNEKLESLKSRTIEQLKSLGNPSQISDKISEFIGNIEDLKLASTGIDLSKFKSAIKALDVGSDLKLSPIPVATNIQLPTELETRLPSIPGVQKELNTGIQALALGDSAAMAKVPSMAEDKAIEMAGLSEIKEQSNVLDNYKEQLDQVKDPGSFAKEGVEQLQQAAIDHFAGKEQVLQAAMDKMSKYKDKYTSLSSLANVPKHPPNEMRGKPLIERLVPSFMVQIQKEGNDLLVDFNPHVGYRFTGKLTAGPGWNQRIGYDTKANDFTAKPRIYGPRLFAEYNLWKGFSPRVEIEVMNAMVAPENQPLRMDLGTRQWVWGAFVGLKKEYRFIKNVKGTALIMTRLFDPHNKSPYVDVLNVRLGFEFPMKKTPKSTSGS